MRLTNLTETNTNVSLFTRSRISRRDGASRALKQPKRLPRMFVCLIGMVREPRACVFAYSLYESYLDLFGVCACRCCEHCREHNASCPHSHRAEILRSCAPPLCLSEVLLTAGDVEWATKSLRMPAHGRRASPDLSVASS